MSHENFFNGIDFSLTGIDANHYISFIQFLDENKKEQDVLVCLANLRTHKKPELLKADTATLKGIAKLCNKYACQLIMKKQDSKEALALLEFAQSLIEPLNVQLDAEYQRIKASILNNLAIYSLNSKDKALNDKYIKAALENERTLKSHQRALIHQNLGVIYMKQRMYDNSINSCQTALRLLESEVLTVIKGSRNTQLLRDNKELVQKATVMLNSYMTIAMVLERIQHNPIQKDLVIQKFGQSLLEKPFFKNGYKLSKILLGSSHSFTLKFKNKLESAPTAEVVVPVETVQIRTRPEWLQKSGILERSHSQSRLLEIPKRVRKYSDTPKIVRNEEIKIEKPHTNLFQAADKPLKVEQNARERLALLLDKNPKEESAKKSDDTPLSSTFSSGSSMKGFRIKHNSFSNLKKQPINFSMEPIIKPVENIYETPMQQSIPAEETKQRSRQGSRREISRPPRTSKSITHLKAVEKEVENLAQSQIAITQNIESILKHQMELENKIQKKIEDTIMRSRSMERQEQTLAQKELELELQLETLKKENEKIQQIKIEKELEIEQLRLQLSTTQNNLTKMSNPPGGSYGYPFFPPYGPYTGMQNPGPMGMPPYPYPQQNYNLNASQMASPDFRGQNASDNQNQGNITINQLVRNSPGMNGSTKARKPVGNIIFPEFNEIQQMKNKTTNYDLSVTNTETFEIQNFSNKNSNFTDTLGLKNFPSAKVDPPEIRVLPTDKHSDEIQIMDSPEELKTISEEGINNEKLLSANTSVDVKGNSTVSGKPVAHLDLKILPTGTLEEVKSSRSNLTSLNRSSRRQGKYSNPESRRFKLDFSELNKKPNDSLAEKARSMNEEKSLPPKESNTQTTQKINPMLPKPNSSTAIKQESVTSFAMVQTKEISLLTDAGAAVSKQAILIHKLGTGSELKQGSLGSISTANTNSKHQPRFMKSEESECHETILNTLGSAQQIQIPGVSEHYESKFDPSPKINQSRFQTPISLSWLLETPDYIKLPKKAQIKKPFTLPDDINLYIIDCVLENDGAEPLIKLILNQKPLTHDECWVLFEEKYTITQIKKILKETEYRDVLPSTWTIRSIRSYENLIKYCIFPFVRISEDKQSIKKLDLWAKAPSFLNALAEVQFYDQKCFLSLHHVARTDFRVVVTHTETGDTFRIDLTLDESSFANYFAWIKPTNKIDNPIEDLLSVIDVLEDDEASAEQLEATTRIIKKYENPEFLEIELESCKLKDSEKEKLLLEYVKKTLREIEGVLQAKGLNDFYKLCDMSSKFKYFKLRVFNEFKRTSFSALMENPEKNGIDVYLKNFFETHAPKDRKVKAEGKTFYPISRVWKDFALDYLKMEQDDKTSLFCIVSELFKLHTLEKPLLDSDTVIYEENPIVQLPIDCGSFSRVYKGQNYKYPVTSVLVGVNGYALGVKTYIYDLEQCTEKGVFFYVDSHLWKKKEGAAEKKLKKNVVTLPMLEKYNFENVLTRKGFEVIDRHLVYEQTSNRVDLHGVNSLRTVAQTELLENMLNVQNFVNYYRETQDLDL